MPAWTRKNLGALRDVPQDVVELSAWDGLDVLCIGGRKPPGGDTEKVPDFWA